MGDLTPLHLAARYNSKDVAEILCYNGASTNEKTNDDWTPLHLAACYNS